MWTDYDYALLYECFDPQEDGSCPEDQVVIVVFGRTETLPEKVIGRLIPIAADACVTVEDFEIVPHRGECTGGERREKTGVGVGVG